MTKLAVLEVLPIVARRMALERDRPGARSYDWRKIARPNQLPPLGPWRFWLILTGRGWGKTRTGSEWVRERVRASAYVNIIGATADDARDIMIEGESGILAVCPDGERPDYLPSKRRLEWPNGARSLIFTADEPERLRGKQHSDLWGDEIAAWRYQEAFDQAMFGLRLGSDPKALFTSTPRPVKAIKTLLADPNCVVTRGATYENRDNLAPAFYEQVINRYEGTRLGRQELAGEVLEDVEGALWSLSQIDALRVKEAPTLLRVVVAIDPAVTSGEDSDETGIIVAGVGDCRCKAKHEPACTREEGCACKLLTERHGFILADLSGRYSPDGWARRAVGALDSYKGDRIVAEVNNGGDMVEQTLRTIYRPVPYKKLHASRGKVTRAEPVAALYEQGKVHHVGSLSALEDQMTTWVPGMPSPDRMDALVWALTELMLSGAYTEVPEVRMTSNLQRRR